MDKKTRELDATSLLKRLAKYHNAKLVCGDVGRGIYFQFKCKNEAMAWDRCYIDKRKKVHADYDAKPVFDVDTFLENYIGQRMFFRTVGDGWSDDFDMFGPRMLKCSSREELDVKLAVAGF